jgi:hypothetical protein
MRHLPGLALDGAHEELGVVLLGSLGDVGVEGRSPGGRGAVAGGEVPHGVAEVVGGVAAAHDQHALVAQGGEGPGDGQVAGGGRRLSMLSCTTGQSAAGRMWWSTLQVPWSRPQSLLAEARPAPTSSTVRRARAASPGAGYCMSKSAWGKPPKSWMVSG